MERSRDRADGVPARARTLALLVVAALVRAPARRIVLRRVPPDERRPSCLTSWSARVTRAPPAPCAV